LKPEKWLEIGSGKNANIFALAVIEFTKLLVAIIKIPIIIETCDKNKKYISYNMKPVNQKI